MSALRLPTVSREKANTDHWPRLDNISVSGPSKLLALALVYPQDAQAHITFPRSNHQQRCIVPPFLPVNTRPGLHNIFPGCRLDLFTSTLFLQVPGAQSLPGRSQECQACIQKGPSADAIKRLGSLWDQTTLTAGNGSKNLASVHMTLCSELSLQACAPRYVRSSAPPACFAFAKRRQCDARFIARSPALFAQPLACCILPWSAADPEQLTQS